MKFVTGALLAITAASFISGPTLANAGVVKQGSDYTNYYRAADGKLWMKVCDKEADNHGVHGDFDFHFNNTSIMLNENGGASSACEVKQPGSAAIDGLWRHRTVEERNWPTPDVKGEYDYNH